MNRFTIYAISLGGTVVPGNTEITLEEDDDVARPMTDGDFQNRLAAVLQRRRQIPFTSLNVEGVLDALGSVFGAAISDLTGGVIFYLRKRGAVGGAASGHYTATVTGGLVVVETVNGQDGSQFADITCRAYAASGDGTNAVTVESGSLGTIPSISSGWKLGPAKLNASTYEEGVQSWTLNMNPDVDVEEGFGDGSTYPKLVELRGSSPTAAVTVSDAANLSTFDEPAAISAATELWLREVAKNNVPTAESASAHVQFTINEGMIRHTSSGGSQTAETELEIVPTYDGATDSVQYTTDQAISVV